MTYDTTTDAMILPELCTMRSVKTNNAEGIILCSQRYDTGHDM